MVHPKTRVCSHILPLRFCFQGLAAKRSPVPRPIHEQTFIKHQLPNYAIYNLERERERETMERDATSMLKPLQLNGALSEMKRAEADKKKYVICKMKLKMHSTRLELAVCLQAKHVWIMILLTSQWTHYNRR